MFFALLGGCVAPTGGVGTDPSHVTGSGKADDVRPVQSGTWPSFSFSNVEVEQGTDAALGLQHILAGDGLPVGLPLSLAKRAAPQSIVADRASFERYGHLPAPSWRADGVTDAPNLPLGLSSRTRTAGGPVLANNCFTCHANAVGDDQGGATVLLGAGSAHVNQAAILDDYRAARSSTALSLLRATTTDADRELFLRMGDDVLLPSAQFARTRGENFGQWFVWWRIALLVDPATRGLELRPAGEKNPELARTIEAQELVPADPIAWWNRKYKRSSYWWGDPGSARHFAFSFNQPVGNAEQSYLDHIAVVDRVLAYANSTRSPAYPYALDQALVEDGRALFHGEREIEAGGTLGCYSCHGNYEATGDGYIVDYPELFVPGDEVGTDSAYRDVVVALSPVTDSMNQLQTYFDAIGRSGDAPSVDISNARTGYLAPPLDGVWASAPYFHNGSVPTLNAVLDSSARPAQWSRSIDATAYDYTRVGLVVEDRAQDGTERATYDTSRYGRGNGGHTFGDAMSASERLAVIEFLKSLSGPGMGPR